MKNFFSSFLSLFLVFLLFFGASSFSPSAFASSSELMSQYSAVRDQMLKSRNDPQQRTQLRSELLSLRKQIRESRKSDLQQRRAERRRRLQIIRFQRDAASQNNRTIRPVELSSPETPQDNRTILDVEFGKASYYADKFNGRTTASGSIFSNSAMTAAHKTLPFGTFVRVFNIENGKSIEIEITDRGPYVEGRVIDLSSSAFSLLGNLSQGVLNVRVEILSR